MGNYHNDGPGEGPRPDFPHKSYRDRRTRFPSKDKDLEPRTGPVGKRGEPLSLAEVLVAGRVRGQDAFGDAGWDDMSQDAGTVSRENAVIPFGETVLPFDEVNEMPTADLIAEVRRVHAEAEELGTPGAAAAAQKRCEPLAAILRDRMRRSALMIEEGTLEIMPDQFGFLRVPDFQYLSSADDIYVSPSQIRRFGLRPGSLVSGPIRPPKENEKNFALLRVETVNGRPPGSLLDKPWFDDLTPIHPDSRIVMEPRDGDPSARVVDMLVPVGFGQRGLIVSPPRAGKTVLMQKLARSVLDNYPDAYVFVLLIDERPEEVTDMIRTLRGPRCEVIGSTFDETPERHIQVSEVVLNKAKRMVEYGKDVLIFLDSLTRLSRAWNTQVGVDGSGTGKTLSGGLDSTALQNPKRFFGAARKVEGGGSLTILATVLVETGSRMDDVIFEEFKGTGNLEIHLTRELAERRIWPAIDILRSGTRRDEALLNPEEYRHVTALRRQLADLNPVDAMGQLLAKIAKTKSNVELLMSVKPDS